MESAPAGPHRQSAVPATEAGARWPAALGAVIAISAALRCLYAFRVELLPEETYYWAYSRHLDIGYLDHPPMVAWLIRCGTALFGQTEFGVRVGAIACAAAASVFLYRLTRNLFGERSGFAAVALAQVLPFFFLSGLLMTPDSPLTACWAACLYFLERALVAGRGGAWLWAGAVFGVGLLSKYTIGLLGVATVLFMLADPSGRRWFRRWEPYAAVLIAAALFTPVIIWNAEHDWASFLFQTSRRIAEAPRFSVHKLLGGAAILLTPTGLFAAAGMLRTGDPASPGRRFLRYAALVPLAVFLIFSLRHEVKLDWTGAPWTAVLPVLGLGIAGAGDAGVGARRWMRAAWPPTVVVLLLTYGVGLCYLTIGLPGVGYSTHMELLPLGWRQLARQIDAIAAPLRATDGARLLIVGMDRYAIASELAFYSADPLAVERISSGHLYDEMGLMYGQWFPLQAQTGRTLLLVAWDAASLATGRLEQHAAAVGPLHEGVLVKDGRMLRRYYYRVAQGYQYR